MAKKICFMVMPFSKKRTGLKPSQGPTEVDFDALWERALSPALSRLGYHPVRADQDVGALIIVEMIERLAYSDLVVADISISNANVYYEIGVRHAAKRHGCVLVSARWGKTLFDIDQMPRLVYPLTDGSVPQGEAEKIQQILVDAIPSLAEGASPVYQAVPRYQEGVTEEMRSENFAEEVEALNEVVNRIHAVHQVGDRQKRQKRALALRDELEPENLQDGVRLAMMQMLRDCAGDWDVVIDYIENMPKTLRLRPLVKEQLLLAKAKTETGDPELAIAALRQLIEESGPTAERWGLIGGRYKQLYDSARKRWENTRKASDKKLMASYLSQSIEAYEQGMMADLNEFYPTCNLPRLLRMRGDEGDLEKARAASVVVAKACERAQQLDPDNEWIPLTRLGNAFDGENPVEAKRLAREILRDFEALWKKNTTIQDLRKSVALVLVPARKRALQEVLIQLESILPEEERVTRVDEPVEVEPGAAQPGAAPSAPPTPPAAPGPQAQPAAPTPAPPGTEVHSRVEPREGHGDIVVTVRIERPR